MLPCFVQGSGAVLRPYDCDFRAFLLAPQLVGQGSIGMRCFDGNWDRRHMIVDSVGDVFYW